MDLSLRQLSFWRYLFREGIHGPKPDQYRENLRNTGPTRTSAEKVKMGSGPNIFESARASSNRYQFHRSWTNSYQDKGTDRTKTTKILKTSDQFGPIGQWIPDSEYASNHLSGSASLSVIKRARSWTILRSRPKIYAYMLARALLRRASFQCARLYQIKSRWSKVNQVWIWPSETL